MSRASSTASVTNADFQPDEAFARDLDEQDPLRSFRERFHLPRRAVGEPVIYFSGNSLGLQPKSVEGAVDRELEDWATLAADAHLKAHTPWYSYHEALRESGCRLVGASAPSPQAGCEIVMMNSLTVNLHLMLATFFAPSGTRQRILMEYPAFPSDLYAVQTHLRHRGLDPADTLLQIKPLADEHTLRTEAIEALLEEQGEQIALVLLPGVNFFTGQVFDMKRITAAAHRHGCVVGWDLAHAAGNVPLALHDWDVDFACWCSYKYLNGGPGAVAGCFVHERHGRNLELPRLAGWWGNDPETRFRMHLQPQFVPQPGAEGWQISNPPIFSMAPLKASLEIFDEAGLEALRAKSVLLTGYLRYLIEQQPPGALEIITPAEPDACGCQLSLLVHDEPEAQFKRLVAEGVACDLRQPNVIRVAPVPLYNTFHEAWAFSQVLCKSV